MAEESMVLFGALITGDLALVPSDLLRIDQLSERRKRLEDELRAGTSSGTVLVEEIEAVESEIGKLRLGLPEYADSTALLRFRETYLDYYARGSFRG